MERDEILAQLDAADKEVPQNPGLFNVQAKDGETFADMFEKSLGDRDNKVGDVVKGRVVEVQEDYVLVDINYKSEGLIPISEFRVTTPAGAGRLWVGRPLPP